MRSDAPRAEDVPPGRSRRAAVVAIAREYEGSRFVHQGRTKSERRGRRVHGGIDCAGLVIVTGQRSGYLPDGVDVRGYGRQPDGRMILSLLNTYAVQVSRDPLPGDVLLLRWPSLVFPHHLGIATDLPGEATVGLIHASMERRRVVEHGWRGEWGKGARTVGVWCFPGLLGVPWEG